MLRKYYENMINLILLFDGTIPFKMSVPKNLYKGYWTGYIPNTWTDTKTHPICTKATGLDWIYTRPTLNPSNQETHRAAFLIFIFIFIKSPSVFNLIWAIPGNVQNKIIQKYLWKRRKDKTKDDEIIENFVWNIIKDMWTESLRNFSLISSSHSVSSGMRWANCTQCHSPVKAVTTQQDTRTLTHSQSSPEKIILINKIKQKVRKRKPQTHLCLSLSFTVFHA